jgi:uncharacterized Zn finger protein
MREQPELYKTVEAAMDQSKTGPSAANKRKRPTAKRKKVDVEPYPRRVRGIMHSLDRMQASEAYWHVGGLTDELRGVKGLEEAAFHDSPSLAKWQTIKRIAGSRWKRLKPKLMASLEKSYNDQPLVEVLLEERDWDAAIKVADRKGQYYRVVAAVADGTIQHRPEWVIRASIKQAEDLIAPAKSKYYPQVAEWLRRAQAVHTQVGQTEEWRKYLLKLKEQYQRRPALMAQLERL